MIVAAVVGLSVVAMGSAIRFTEEIDATAIIETQGDLARLNLVLSEQTASIFQSIDLVLVVRRIATADGRFVGVVIASISLEYFESLYREVRLGRNIGVGLWRDDSTLMVRYPAVGRVGGKPNPAIAANHRAVLGICEAGTGRVAGELNRTALLLSVRHIRGHSLYMTVSLPESAVTAQTYSTRVTVIGATGVMTLATWFIAALSLRQWREHRRFRDEAERRRAAELQAIESEARFRDGIESMGDGFLLWDKDDRVLTWNALLIELLPETAAILRRGLSRQEFVRHINAVALRHLSDADRLAWQEQLRVNREQGKATEVTSDAGRRILMRDRRTSEGGCVSTYTDITSEVEARQRAEAGEAQTRRLALVAQHMHGAVVILDEKSRITWCNAAFTTLSGYTPEEALGKPPRALLFGPLTSLTAAQSIAAAINAGRHITTEMIYYRKDGTTFDVEVDAAPVLDSTGRLEGVIGVHIDVTERNRQAAALEEALATQREVSAQQRRFISIVSYEFRTPITIIDGATQVLQRKLGTEGRGEIDTRLDRIRRAVARMTDLVERTLQSARLDEGRIEMRSRLLDLRPLVEEACMRQRVEHAGFEIAVDVPPDCVMVEGDPVLLDQVVTNLLSNAIKYSGDSRRIEISLAAPPEGLDLRVRDYGIGVKADELPKLFDRFYRAKAASAISGVGVGLHLVRELVAMNGGSVEAASCPGEGSTFIVRLPRAQPECSLARTG